MYTFESRVRFSEADHTELLTLPGLVNYFQDCSTFQSEDIGYGVESLKKSGQAWILSPSSSSFGSTILRGANSTSSGVSGR